MFKMFKRLKPLEWLSLLAIAGVTVLQVWCSMLMIDRMSDLVKELQLLGMDPLVLQALGMEPGSISNVWKYGGFMILFAFGSALCQIAISVLASAVIANFATRLRTSVNDKINSFSLAEINRFSAASLVTRSTNDIETVYMTMLMSFRMLLSAPITAIWAICKIQASSGELTFLTAMFLLALVIALALLIVLVMPKFRVVQKMIDRLNGVTRENLKGIRVVRAYNAEGYQEAKFKKANDDLTKLNLFTSRTMGLMMPFITIIMDGVTLGTYWVGAKLINEGSISYATVSSFVMLSTQIVMSVMMLLFLLIMMPRASVSAKRVNEVLETKATILDPEQPEEFKEKGTISFDHVTFAYPGAKGNAIEDASFSVKKGETLAVVGSTGCGKTSLINLIARLYDVKEGSVRIDGVDVRSAKQADLRAKIGFVPQKGFLFSGTVASNLRQGAPNATEEELRKATDIACASEFIDQMENGFDAPIAQGGTNVSGGQRQRLCIARAAAIRPEIFVFDDSFSALDFKTDLQVRTNLKKEFADSTKVIVAQRIGTIMDADRILVLDQGKIVGQGKHEELLRNCEVYRDLALSQLSKEELGL